MKRMKISILVLPTLILIYSMFFEPINLESTFHETTIGTSGKSLLIAHLTDLHTNGFGSLENKLIDSLRSQKPDIIIITGDIATPSGTAKGYKEVLSKLHAPLGTYFVQGNWEYWEPVKELRDIFKSSNIIDLTNKYVQIIDELWLVGLDDELAGSPQVSTYESLPAKAKIISIFHSPALFNSISSKTNLAFAGHSHGGQVRFPFIGSIWTPEGTDKYVSGWFEEGKAKMYVSRGIGTSVLPIRFNCRPEVAFIKVNF
jgi:predicted MPP superfamily phosphohydrolase